MVTKDEFISWAGEKLLAMDKVTIDSVYEDILLA
jgi:hypothetical protein